MKNLHFCFVSLFLALNILLNAQVAINTDGSPPDASAMLDIKSATGGMLLPRMTVIQRDAISSPANGLMVFVTDDSTFYYYRNSAWEKIGQGASNWETNGNTIFTDSTKKVVIGSNSTSGTFSVITDKSTGTYNTDRCTGGTASASESYAGQPAANAFDDASITYWSNNGNLPAWLQYDFGDGKGKVIARYRLYYEGSGFDASPNNWTLEASDDGSTWTTLDIQSGQGWTANQWKEYSFSNTVRYRYYRINISDNAGTTSSFVSINEMEMMELIYIDHPSLFVGSDNNVGIGTSSPAASLDVNGSFRLTDGNQSDGFILTTDASGNAAWASGDTLNAGGWIAKPDYTYTQKGTTVIGSNLTPLATTKLYVENTDKDRTVNLSNTNSSNSSLYGLFNSVSGNGNGSHYGSYNELSGAGTGFQCGSYQKISNSGYNIHYGFYSHLSGTGLGGHYAIYAVLSGTGTGRQYGSRKYITNSGDADHYGDYNLLDGGGTGIHYGTYNTLSGAGTGQQYGSRKEISNSGNADHYGDYNRLDGSGSGAHYGTNNELSGTGTGIQYGSRKYINNLGNSMHFGDYNALTGSGSGIHYGTYNYLYGTGTGKQYGSYQEISNSGDNTHYGTYNDLSGSGTGAKYGVYSTILATAGGTHYAIYGSATKAGSYAGYFDGDVRVTQKLTKSVSGDADLKIYVYGSLSLSTGNAYASESSTGFTSVKTATGVYEVTFSSYATDRNYLIIANALNSTEPIILTYEKFNGYFNIKAWNLSGALVDTYLNFIVIRK